MPERYAEYALEFLLDFDGRIHHLEWGYWLKFAIKRGAPSAGRPYGFAYAFTLHGADGRRLLGYDNAHRASEKRQRGGVRIRTFDHWHSSGRDKGRPSRFVDAETLLDDFFDAVERELSRRGVSTIVIGVEEEGSKP